MPNITRGADMGGLMRYLAGPGRVNEHTDPHLVAGDPAVTAWVESAGLDAAAAGEIASSLDEPRRAFGTEVAGGHVWHCSLSLRAEEGQLPDETWAAIARDFVAEMGYDGSDGKAPCRWVAVRHGVSTAGNDHIHIAVSLVREDGTKASTWMDQPRSQRAARDLERRYGLQVLESREKGRGSRGVSRPELERQKTVGAVEPERVALARVVRGVAAQADSEAEFVRGLRTAGMLARPRFAAGTTSVVVGYSVAARPAGAEDRPVWFGGGQLSRDLTLPRLRQGWPDTVQSAEEAVAAWTATEPARAAGRRTAALDPAVWQRHAAEVGALREWLRTIPAGDTAAWAAAAQEAAGMFAAWSTAVEGGRPGPLAQAADTLARSAQVRAGVAARPAGMPSTRSAARLVASAARGGRGSVAEAALLMQLRNTARAIHDAHAATQDAQRAAEIAGVMRGRLADLARPATAPTAARTAAVVERPRAFGAGPEQERGWSR